MDLPSSFHYKDWTIKYRLTSPASSSESSFSSNSAVKTVVFVHGTPWSSAVYEPLARALSATGSYRILLYDLPGYGQSQTFDDADDSSNSTQPNTSTAATNPDPNSSDPSQTTFRGNTSVAFQSLTLAALLTHLSLTSSSGPHPSIIAHDIAGAIVLHAHLLHGLEYADMLLLDTNAVLPWGDGFYQLARAQPRTFLQMPPDIYEAVLGAVVRSACFGRAKGWEEVLVGDWVDDKSGDQRARQMAFVRQIAQADDADVREMLEADAYARVRCDVRIIWGQEDRWIPRWKVEELARRLGPRHKGTVVVPEAGHLVMLDQPERVAVEVFSWLQR